MKFSDTKNYQEILNTSGFFKNLSEKHLQELMSHVELKIYQAGEIILTEGQENSSLYFLLDGFLNVTVHGEKVSELRRFGEVIGEISLISSAKASATVKAQKESTVLLCKINEWKKVSPDALREFEASQFKLFSAILAERLVITNDKARLFEIANKELSEAKNLLEQANKELESRVLERTTELAEKNIKLESIVLENQQLVRVLCHDLNNTLAVIQLTSALAIETLPKLTPERQLDHWRRVQKASVKQKDLISYVRELTAIESGKKELKLSAVSLLQVIEASKFIFQERLLEKDLKIVDKLQNEVKVMAEAVTLTHSVISNLISNAIKFSTRGKSIEISGHYSGDRKFVLLIRDEGIGIPKEILQNLFELNKKTSRPGTEGESGTGFGMPLVYTTMKAFGGDVDVESVSSDENTQGQNQKQSGTIFKLTFNVG